MNSHVTSLTINVKLENLVIRTDTRNPRNHIYMKGVMERLQRTYKKHHIHFLSTPRYTIRNAVVCPKDLLEPEETCGVAYKCKCEECSQLYVGKTDRSLGERYQKNMTSLRRRVI